MKRSLTPLLLAGVFTTATWAADMGATGHGGMGHGAMHIADMHDGAMDNALSQGMIRKVNKAQGKLTIRHGPLENLDMPAMTMIFRVADPAWLDKLEPNDSVRFRAEMMNGRLTVTKIELVQ